MKVVMLEALEMGGKVNWIQNLEESLRMFGWGGMSSEALGGLSMEEVKKVLTEVAWREVRGVWRKEAQRRPKLDLIGRLMEKECEGHGMMVKGKMRRRRLVKLRGGTAELAVEPGRWQGLKREERICKDCRGGEVEDVGHLLMCEWVEGWQDMHDNDRVLVVMDRACGDEAVGRAVVRLWQRRFTAGRHHPST